MTDLDKLKTQFFNKGLTEFAPIKFIPKILDALLWQPTFLLSDGSYTYLVLVKTNNTVLPTFLNRVASIPNRSYVPVIIFCQKPTATDEKFILSLGISIGYFIKGKLYNLNFKKKIPQNIVQKEIKKKLPVIDIFISSKQNIPERKFVEERIENLRKINSYPFNPPHLIEYDKFKLNKLYQHIDEKMEICEWIVIILEDNHSNDVRYEINKAIKEFDHDNIFMFVKSTNACQTVWKKELTKVKKLESKSIKYLPYSNLSELEVYLSKAVKERINEICRKHKIEIFV
ncbi:MAG: hypothetical protein M0Q26_14275 [Chitinophagaceae bacterium]|nr:hypothetical protein [Chitinophagaceae bacterium]